jgi:hypothetical protein
VGGSGESESQPCLYGGGVAFDGGVERRTTVSARQEALWLKYDRSDE